MHSYNNHSADPIQQAGLWKSDMLLIARPQPVGLWLIILSHYPIRGSNLEGWKGGVEVSAPGHGTTQGTAIAISHHWVVLVSSARLCLSLKIPSALEPVYSKFDRGIAPIWGALPQNPYGLSLSFWYKNLMGCTIRNWVYSRAINQVTSKDAHVVLHFNSVLRYAIFLYDWSAFWLLANCTKTTFCSRGMGILPSGLSNGPNPFHWRTNRWNNVQSLLPLLAQVPLCGFSPSSTRGFLCAKSLPLNMNKVVESYIDKFYVVYSDNISTYYMTRGT